MLRISKKLWPDNSLAISAKDCHSKVDFRKNNVAMRNFKVKSRNTNLRTGGCCTSCSPSVRPIGQLIVSVTSPRSVTCLLTSLVKKLGLTWPAWCATEVYPRSFHRDCVKTVDQSGAGDWYDRANEACQRRVKFAAALCSQIKFRVSHFQLELSHFNVFFPNLILKWYNSESRRLFVFTPLFFMKRFTYECSGRDMLRIHWG